MAASCVFGAVYPLLICVSIAQWSLRCGSRFLLDSTFLGFLHFLRTISQAGNFKPSVGKVTCYGTLLLWWFAGPYGWRGTIDAFRTRSLETVCALWASILPELRYVSVESIRNSASAVEDHPSISPPKSLTGIPVLQVSTN